MNKENTSAKNVTISFKTTIEEKTALQQIANEKNITRSELLASIVQANKYNFDYLGKESPAEAKLKDQLAKSNKEIRGLRLSLENAEHRIQIEQKANREHTTNQLEQDRTIFKLKQKLTSTNSEINSLNLKIKELQSTSTIDNDTQLLYGSLGSLLISSLALIFAPRILRS